MGVLDGLAKRLGYTKTAQIPNPAPWLSSYAGSQQYNIPDPAVYGNQADLYCKLSWISTAVTILAQSCAVVKFNVKKLQGEDETDIKNHDFERLLNKPNPLQSRAEFLESWFSYRIVTGNGYIWLNRSSETAAPAEMWCIPSDIIQPVPDGNMFIKGYLVTTGDGKQIPLEPWEICHLKSFNPRSMFVGLSKIESIAMSAMTDLARTERDFKTNKNENGRLPGILAFADHINDPDWARMKHEIDDKANKLRQYMLLRGAGQGGVNWISTAMSAADMQYIESRTFTKEEIYGVFAPGLASMLAINATEANSKSGKATFSEYAQWPLLDAAAQKISNDILPVYGENLIGEFDEVRVKDRVLELQEIAEYSKTHTVEEIRRKYYQDDPLGDERDGLFPVQITATNGVDSAVDEAQQNPAQEQPTEQPPEAESQAIENMAQAEEMKAWRRKSLNAIKKGRPADVEFETDVIPLGLSASIHAALKTASTADEVRAIFERDYESDNSFLAVELKRANDLLEKVNA